MNGMILQTDPAWLPARVGKLTASRMADAMNFKKDGKPGADRIKLLHEIVAERATGSAWDHYVTPAMQWGLDNEPGARQRYETISGNIVMPGGLLDHPTIEWFAATPDGLIDDDGLLEIKCPTTTKYVAWRMNGVVPEEHRAQMIAQLACFRRRYVDFVAYDPRIKNEDHQLFVRRFEPPREEIKAVEDAARQFLGEVERAFEIAFILKEAA